MPPARKRAPIPYVNVPEGVALVVAGRLATLHELQTIYGCEDLHDLLEVLVVNMCNSRPEE